MIENNQNLNLSKLKACNQYWNEMPNHPQGKLCTNCSNVIHDFRNKNKTEIAHIHAISEGNVCGLYSKKQLRSSISFDKRPKKKSLFKSSILGLISILITPETAANIIAPKEKIESLYKYKSDNLNRTFSRNKKHVKQDSSIVTGQVKVLGEDTLGIPGINVIIKGTSTMTSTDNDGNYSIEIPQEIAYQDSVTVTFKFIGYASKNVRIQNKRQELNVMLSPDESELSVFYIYEKPPLHKRVWNWFTKPFK
ncbi:carboxypeptidase-like regulatory domain-containing protein [Marivirga salinae]|uniref:Carboxypeptidase-like regulatory domain-containing protein n=1 Tax=Marivirga salinarum TaxID=3059078 RepID=A0AA51NBU3_9BACT|nr:carboxypeptidase-like regulatory domain-containing protein [Marivirga sp. BDSF4-3]WMN10750.1 carboxypeptidase-like regulatory domain-containing protein [Marivirga sp. BDSF4-3]